MSHTFIARMKVRPGREAEFIRLCHEMEADTVKEPDCLYYKFFRLRQPLAFAVIESFATEGGDAAHQETAHFKRIVGPMLDCLDGAYVREYLDPLE